MISSNLFLTFGITAFIIKLDDISTTSRRQNMNLNVRGIHYQISDETREFLDKKLAKLDFAESYLHDLDITMKRETLGQGFHIDAKLHFSWGTVKVVSYDCYELYEGIEMIADKIEAAARKEKGKVIE